MFGLMKATGRTEAEILSWPIERFNTYVECMNDDEESSTGILKKLFGR